MNSTTRSDTSRRIGALNIYDAAQQSDPDILRTHLNELFTSSNRRLTNRVVVNELRAEGYLISESYLSQLRSGARRNPSDTVLSALEAYFEVSQGQLFSAHWTTDRGRREMLDHDARIVARLPASNFKRFLTQAVGLSGPKLRLLEALAKELGIAENQRQDRDKSDPIANNSETS